MVEKRRGSYSRGLGAPGVESHASGRSRGKRRRLLWVASMAFIVGLGAYAFFATTDFLPGAKAAGEAAPDITLGTEKGGFRLSEQKGKVLVLYFSFPG